MAQQASVHLEGFEECLALLGLGFLAHARPDIRVDEVGAAHGFDRVLGEGDAGTARGGQRRRALAYLARGLVAARRCESQFAAEHREALSSELATLLPADVRHRDLLEIRALADGLQIGHRLARVRQSVSPLITGIVAAAAKLLDKRVVVRACHDPVHPARQVARHVGGGFARADAHLLGPQQDRVATELGHPRLEGDVRAKRRFLEVHRERATTQRLGRLAAPIAALQLVGA
jgi:hypothetical protein